MLPHTRTPEELQKASNHLAYEYQMFNATAEKLAQPAPDKATTNAFIESFAIHARILMAFLFTEGRIDPDYDVIGEHFFSDPNVWYDKRKINKIKKPTEFDINGRVGKEVAHLTYKRQEVTPEMKIWDITAIQKAINVAMETFLACVPNELLGDRWDDYKKHGLQYTAPAQHPPPQGQSVPKIGVGTAHPGTLANTVTPGVLKLHKADAPPK